MADIDLYSDLDWDKFDENNIGSNLNDVAILQDSFDKLEKEKNVVDSELKEIKEKYERMVMVNKILKTNISSLYKTAKAELERKNDRISELTRQIDDLVFRRRTSSK
ncbi:uncharacterized protein LOC107362343 [Tetranychus urticae]|uniref:Uncharacterized protein n=1 Tax=Tetranychus urticae TaxID=32264 RepID=T1KBX4_TETUR|nr:uncharacterized protein LOC107362343 [Tetranychus urticae]